MAVSEMPVASSCAAMATFSVSDCFSVCSPCFSRLVCASSSRIWRFSERSDSLIWLSESTCRMYERSTSRTVASSFFSRAISRASSDFTFFSSSRSCCVRICSCVSCATMESLLIWVIISLYCMVNRWYSFSISCLSSSASSCISWFTCFCCCRPINSQTATPASARMTKMASAINAFFIINLWG